MVSSKLLKVRGFTLILAKRNPCTSSVIILTSNGVKSNGEKMGAKDFS